MIPAEREGLRRALHLTSGTLGLLALWLPAPVSYALLLAILVSAAGLEAARLASAGAARVIALLAGGAFRPHESRAVSGAALLALGYAVAWCLFPGRPGACGILVAAVADPAAAVVGSRAAPEGGVKTWAGTAAAFVAALAMLMILRAGLSASLAGAVAACLAERLPGRGSDNVAVPVVTAAAVRLAG